MSYWLMKSEPEVYSIEDLKRDGRTEWEGVRNYQARNFMVKEMKLGDVVLFYHSNANPTGIAGLGVVTRLAEPDKSSWNKKSPFFDEKSTPQSPRWFCVEVAFKVKFHKIISLDDLRAVPKLNEMEVLKKGQRLSIMPVRAEEFKQIENMAEK
jgi:predicted RNA-binding protein with PUA-like domain